MANKGALDLNLLLKNKFGPDRVQEMKNLVDIVAQAGLDDPELLRAIHKFNEHYQEYMEEHQKLN